MSDTYDFRAIETHWQTVWQRDKTLNVRPKSSAPDVYILDMFPGPSGPLHMGHAKNYVIGDVITRYRIRQGDNVFHPMGWDAFGLPGEIAAIKQGVHPRDWTQQHIAIQKAQFQSLGIHHDWDCEINTSDPEYYRWNQWLFLKLYERGLAYQAEQAVNWCPHCQTTLANEEIIDQMCERCDTPVEQKILRQWFLKITAYADVLLESLKDLPEWPESIKMMQTHWIGRTEDPEKGTVFKLRDWCISRQRYWGTPIPIVHCDVCGAVPIAESDLPVRLPHIDHFTPDGQSPLSRVSDFVDTSCPKCHHPARRECDTMTGFVCSSWYFLRFTSPTEKAMPFDIDAVRRWLPVAHYIGGKEHAVGHLMYARFMTHFLKDIGLIPFEEPIKHLFNQGVVYKDGTKMSKSRGNVVSIEHMVKTYGADTARVFVLFATPPDRDMAWSDTGVEGIFRFLNRVYRLVTTNNQPIGQRFNETLVRAIHRTICQVTTDLERLHYNTAISRLMELTNAIAQAMEKDISAMAIIQAKKTLVALMAPFAPHLSEALWQHLGHTQSVHCSPWPTYDPVWVQEKIMTIQINGKTRDQVDFQSNPSQSDIEQMAIQRTRIKPYLVGKTVCKTIYVPNRLINFVIG